MIKSYPVKNLNKGKCKGKLAEEANRKAWNHCGFRLFTGPSGETWTHDPLTPSQVRYQLRYTRIAFLSRSQLSYNSTVFCRMQAFFLKKQNFSRTENSVSYWQITLAYGNISKVFRWRALQTERCPSGWRNRSWKPATRKRPWVRIPLSPPSIS